MVIPKGSKPTDCMEAVWWSDSTRKEVPQATHPFNLGPRVVKTAVHLMETGPPEMPRRFRGPIPLNIGRLAPLEQR
eukprot:3019656-Pyramimonas_sp.AAC.1